MTTLATLPTTADVTPKPGDEVVMRVWVSSPEGPDGLFTARTASGITVMVHRWDVEVGETRHK